MSSSVCSNGVCVDNSTCVCDDGWTKRSFWLVQDDCVMSVVFIRVAWSAALLLLLLMYVKHYGKFRDATKEFLALNNIQAAKQRGELLTLANLDFNSTFVLLFSMHVMFYIFGPLHAALCVVHIVWPEKQTVGVDLAVSVLWFAHRMVYRGNVSVFMPRFYVGFAHSHLKKRKERSRQMMVITIVWLLLNFLFAVQVFASVAVDGVGPWAVGSFIWYLVGEIIYDLSVAAFMNTFFNFVDRDLKAAEKMSHRKEQIMSYRAELNKHTRSGIKSAAIVGFIAIVFLAPPLWRYYGYFFPLLWGLGPCMLFSTATVSLSLKCSPLNTGVNDRLGSLRAEVFGDPSRMNTRDQGSTVEIIESVSDPRLLELHGSQLGEPVSENREASSAADANLKTSLSLEVT